MDKSQINQIETLSKTMTQREIANKLNINISTVNYHLNKEKRKEQFKKYWQKKTLEERRSIYKRRLPYLREYQKNKYQTDENYRNKCKEKSKTYGKKA